MTESGDPHAPAAGAQKPEQPTPTQKDIAPNNDPFVTKRLNERIAQFPVFKLPLIGGALRQIHAQKYLETLEQKFKELAAMRSTYKMDDSMYRHLRGKLALVTTHTTWDAVIDDVLSSLWLVTMGLSVLVCLLAGPLLSTWNAALLPWVFSSVLALIVGMTLVAVPMALWFVLIRWGIFVNYKITTMFWFTLVWGVAAFYISGYVPPGVAGELWNGFRLGFIAAWIVSVGLLVTVVGGGVSGFVLERRRINKYIEYLILLELVDLLYTLHIFLSRKADTGLSVRFRMNRSIRWRMERLALRLERDLPQALGDPDPAVVEWLNEELRKRAAGIRALKKAILSHPTTSHAKVARILYRDLQYAARGEWFRWPKTPAVTVPTPSQADRIIAVVQEVVMMAGPLLLAFGVTQLRINSSLQDAVFGILVTYGVTNAVTYFGLSDEAKEKLGEAARDTLGRTSALDMSDE